MPEEIARVGAYLILRALRHLTIIQLAFIATVSVSARKGPTAPLGPAAFVPSKTNSG